jgi:LytS/YehU family sensor histidine kinase
MFIVARIHVALFELVTMVFGLQADTRLRANYTDFATGMALQFYVVTVAVISILEYQARARRAELAALEAERLSAGARALALRSQLNAHFLFNTLNTVAMAVRRSDRDEALSIVVGLGGLLRTVLRRSSAELIPLKDEIEFVTRYLDIERVRFRDRLVVEWLIAPEVQQAAVPALILQPVVENALRHGIEKRSEAGNLRIEASRSGDVLAIAVHDDGPGFASEWVDGTGLSNVRDRLSIHFDTAGRLDVVSKEQGASVRLSLPFTEVNGGAADAEIQNPYR